MALLTWRRKSNMNSGKSIQVIKGRIQELKDSNSTGKKGQLVDLKLQLSKAYREEELYWSQKARTRWLKEGDKNTAFFHASVMKARKQRQITCLQKDNGQWCTNEQEVHEEICGYYKQLFTSGGTDQLEETLQGVPNTITRQMNEHLIRPIGEQEIYKALFSMHQNKSPGIDGMSPLFFQNYWNIVGSNVVNAVSSYFYSCNMLKSALVKVVLSALASPSQLLCQEDKLWIMFSLLMKWIMACISSVSYSFNLNGTKVGYVNANRDDSLICCKAMVQEAKQVKEMLQRYAIASGQLVNFDKSAVFFSRNISRTRRETICQELGSLKETTNGRYLGLPMAIGRTKNQVFGYIKCAVIKKLKGWTTKMLSLAGKEVLIKSVILAMSNYAMACFKLPKGLCDDICKSIANFWWGNNEQEKKLHWISWSKLAEVKGNGGMGFRDLEFFNKALLAKQLWRIISSPNLLVSKVLRSKYLKDLKSLDKHPPISASWSWKNIHSAWSLLEDGLWKRIGDGTQVNIWKDRWILESETGRPATPSPANCHLQTVSQLIRNGRWNGEILQNVFNNVDRERIISMPLSMFKRPDRFFWKFAKSGIYIVKSGYRKAMQDNKRSKRRQRLEEETSWELRKHSVWKQL
nr:uncharacterized protein LOC113719410 [Coffea arabica]